MVALPSPSRTRAGARRSGATGTSSRGPRFSVRPSARSSRGRAGAPRRAPRRTRPARGPRDRSTACQRRRAAGRARRRTRRRVWNSTRTRVGRLCPSPPSPSAGRSPADTGPVPRTCAQIELRVDGVKVMIYALLWTCRSRRRERLVPATAAICRRKTQQLVVGAARRRKNQTSKPSLHKTCQHNDSCVKGSKMSSQCVSSEIDASMHQRWYSA